MTDQQSPLISQKPDKWLRNSLIAALLLFLLAHLDDFSKIFDLYDKTRLALGYPSETLQISESGDKKNLSREMIKLGFKRHYKMLLVAREADMEFPQAEQDVAWSQYLDVLSEWNENLMIYIIQTETWYGIEKSAYLEDVVQPRFVIANNCLWDLRKYGKRDINPNDSEELNKSVPGSDHSGLITSCKLPSALVKGKSTITNQEALRFALENVQISLYCFAAGIPQEKRKGFFEGKSESPERCEGGG